MQIKSWSFLGVVVLSLLLILSGFLLWQISESNIGNGDETKNYSMFLNKYKITRSKLWESTFESDININSNVRF